MTTPLGATINLEASCQLRLGGSQVDICESTAARTFHGIVADDLYTAHLAEWREACMYLVVAHALGQPVQAQARGRRHRRRRHNILV